ADGGAGDRDDPFPGVAEPCDPAFVQGLGLDFDDTDAVLDEHGDSRQEGKADVHSWRRLRIDVTSSSDSGPGCSSARCAMSVSSASKSTPTSLRVASASWWPCAALSWARDAATCPQSVRSNARTERRATKETLAYRLLTAATCAR